MTAGPGPSDHGGTVPAIELREVTREYRRPRTSLTTPPPVVHAVRSVSLRIESGELK